MLANDIPLTLKNWLEINYWHDMKLSELDAEVIAEIRPISKVDETRPSEFYVIWILHVFAQHDKWNHGEDLLRVFRETNSDVVRRYAALALATSGARAQALKMKEYMNSGSPLCRTAMLLATAKLGTDERKFLRKSLRLNDPLEMVCSESHT
jgi:hypothetical protein